jgi:hypothetical protein
VLVLDPVNAPFKIWVRRPQFASDWLPLMLSPAVLANGSRYDNVTG